MKIRKIIAVVLLIVFVVTLPVSLFASNIGAQVLTEKGLSDLISDNLLFDSLPQMVREAIWFQSWYSEEGLDPMQRMLITGIQNGDMLELFNLIIPVDQRENLRNDLVGGVFNWLEGDSTYPEIVIELQPILSNVTGNADKVADWAMTNLKVPPCSSERETQFTEGQYGEELMEVITCKPTAENKPGVVAHLAPMIADAIAEADAPETINLSEQLKESMDEAQALSTKARLNMVRRLLPLLWLLPVVILGLALALVVRSWSDLFTWLGWPLFIVGVIGVLLAGRVIAPTALLENVFMPPPASLPAPAAAIAMAVLGAILSGVGYAMQLQMVIVLVGGVSCLIYCYQSELLNIVTRSGEFLGKFLQIQTQETKQ